MTCSRLYEPSSTRAASLRSNVSDPSRNFARAARRIDWASLSDEELEAIEAFALAAQRRLTAATKAEEQLMIEDRPLVSAKIGKR